MRAAALLLLAACATVSATNVDLITGCEGAERPVYRCAFRSSGHSVSVCSLDGRIVLRSDERPPITSKAKLAIQRAEELTVITLWWPLGTGEQQALLIGEGVLDGIRVPVAKFASQHQGVDSEEICEWTPVGLDELYAVVAPLTTQFEREEIVMPRLSDADGTPGNWAGCRGNGMAVCTDVVTPGYFERNPACRPNHTCGGLFFTCNQRCPPPRREEVRGDDGTFSNWSGCRGHGLAICTELVNESYFARNPACTPNATCAGQFYKCNTACSPPLASEKRR